jgi:hypothetical protein
MTIGDKKKSTIIYDICHVKGRGTWLMTLAPISFYNRRQWIFEIAKLPKT